MIEGEELSREEKMCGNKIIYYTEYRARVSAGYATLWYGEIFNPYRCPYCGYYHIGRSRYQNE